MLRPVSNSSIIPNAAVRFRDRTEAIATSALKPIGMANVSARSWKSSIRDELFVISLSNALEKNRSIAGAMRLIKTK